MVAVQLLIGRNEEPFLPYAIRSVAWADYYTVVNTAPTSKWGAINEDIVWQEIPASKCRYSHLEPDENGYFSFADARNLCLSMTAEDDQVLIVDADDVHFPEFEGIVKDYISKGVDSITAHFYHLMVYKDLYQYVQPREIVYTNYHDTSWYGGVHEGLNHRIKWPATTTYHYMHYGYIKPQKEVFRRWKFYSDLDGDFHHYDGQDPDQIVEDRVSVSKTVPVDHPPVIKAFLRDYASYHTPVQNRETVPQEKVGLILLTYNDRENLDQCLSTLQETRRWPDFEILALDMASTDESVEVLQKYQQLGLPMNIEQSGELLSLTESLNYGLELFRVRHDIQYIGWIHPDMIFKDPQWLLGLWDELREHPKIGKVCSANTRDNVPSTLIPGQEQCYIIRKDIINKVGLFDEGYVGIGGYEDWDYNRRIINHNDYKVMITPKSQVFHEGMATRSKRDTTEDQISNASYYATKWGTDKPPV